MINHMEKANTCGMEYGEAVALTERQMCNRYVGEFQKGLRHGNGSFFFANGSRYHGEFKKI